MKNRSENLAGRGQILPVLQANSGSIGQKSGEVCAGQTNLQPIPFKSNRLLGTALIFGTALIANPPAQASCSATLCAINTQPVLLYTPPGLRLDLRYEHVRQDQLQSGTSAVTGQVNTEDELENKSINQNLVATLDYQYDGPWGVSLQWPLSRRQHQHAHVLPPDPAEQESWRFTELGDLRLLGRYQWEPEHHPQVGGIQFGLKLPMGRSNASNDLGEPAERSFQPGSGSTDVLLGGFYKYQLGKTAWDGFIHTLWQSPLIRQQAYQPGSKITLDIGHAYTVSTRLRLLAQLNSQWRGRDRGSLANPLDTGGSSIYFSPGLHFSLTDTVQVYGVVQRQLYQHVNGTQLTAPWGAVLGFTQRI